MTDMPQQCLADWREWAEDIELLHPASSIAQADVYVVRGKDTTRLLKTVEAAPYAVRRLWGGWVLHRESRTLQRLGGVRGVPKSYGMSGRYTLVMEYLDRAAALQDSRELARCEYPPVQFFTRARELLARIHGEGIAHGDIRRKNLLVAADGRPCIVDFATAVSDSQSRLSLRRLLYRMLCRADEFALLKIQHSYYPESLDGNELKELAARPWYVSAGRFLRKKIYRRFFKQKRWKERLGRLTHRISPRNGSHPEQIRIMHREKTE